MVPVQHKSRQENDEACDGTGSEVNGRKSREEQAILRSHEQLSYLEDVTIAASASPSISLAGTRLLSHAQSQTPSHRSQYASHPLINAEVRPSQSLTFSTSRPR